MRNVFRLLAVLVPLALAASAARAEEQPKAKDKKRILLITESRGFVHDVVRRPSGWSKLAFGEDCLVEKVCKELADKTGRFEVVCSQDSRKDITAENLARFDAVFFYTTGELPLSDTQKADLLAFVKKGGGFGGTHSATDTFYKWPEYGQLIGGYFDGHPWHQKVKVVVEDRKHPATRHLGDSFEITDEIYQFRAPYGREQLHVLMRLEPTWAAEARAKELKAIEDDKKTLPARLDKIEAEAKELQARAEKAKADAKEAEAKDLKARADAKAEEGKKLKNQVENRKPGIHRTDNDYAIAWTHEYGKGRVFYTALGHRPEVWKDERFQQMVVGGLSYITGLENADATPTPLPRGAEK
jgi:type 1 glutamine amidotransferase